MILTKELNPVTKISLRKCPTDSTLTEILIERDNGRNDDSVTKWQFFLDDEEMIQFEDVICSYNRAFVDY